jgi:hypothetical protein
VPLQRQHHSDPRQHLRSLPQPSDEMRVTTSGEIMRSRFAFAGPLQT